MRELYKRIEEKGERGVYIYGAGKIAKMVLDNLFDENLERFVAGILVTSKERNPDQIRGIDVIEMNAVKDLADKLIYLAVSPKKQGEIKEMLLHRSVPAGNILTYGTRRTNAYSLVKIIDVVKDCRAKNIYIYGTGSVATKLIKVMIELGLNENIKGFVVTKKGEETALYEHPVYEMNGDLANDNSIFIVGTRDGFVDSIERNLAKFGVKEEAICILQFYAYYVLDQQERIINAKPKIKEWFGENYYLTADRHDITYSELHMKTKEDEDFCVKLDPLIIEPQFPYYVVDWRNYDLRAEYLKEFGEDLRLGKTKTCEVGDFDFSHYFDIYMISSHNDFTANVRDTDRFLTPIQAGAALAEERKYAIADNDGIDNISKQNRTLCELTATYWVWKNSKHKMYKGVCHYRRHFDLDEKAFRRIVDEGIDVVLTTPRINAYGNLNLFLMGYLVAPIDIDIVKRTIAEHFPDYVDSMNEHFNQKFFFNCNMVIAKESIFNEYCEFLFGVILPLDDYFRNAGIMRTNKFSAYFAELITSLFFYHNRNRWNIKTTDLIFYE